MESKAGVGVAERAAAVSPVQKSWRMVYRDRHMMQSGLIEASSLERARMVAVEFCRRGSGRPGGEYRLVSVEEPFIATEKILEESAELLEALTK